MDTGNFGAVPNRWLEGGEKRCLPVRNVGPFHKGDSELRISPLAYFSQ